MNKLIALALVVIAINLTVSNLATLLGPPAHAADSISVRLAKSDYEKCDGYKCGMPVYVVNFPTR
jgi:hypothetical protein